MAVVGENWTAAAFVQIFLSAISTVLLFQVIKDVTGSTGQAAGLALFYKIIMDVSMWNKRRKDYILFLVFVVLFFMTRTNFIFFLIVLFGTVFLPYPKRSTMLLILLWYLFLLYRLRDYLLQEIMKHMDPNRALIIFGIIIYRVH